MPELESDPAIVVEILHQIHHYHGAAPAILEDVEVRDGLYDHGKITSRCKPMNAQKWLERKGGCISNADG